MSCTDVQTIQAGNGTKTQFSFDFPYIFKSEIHVYFWNATTKEWDEKLTTDGTYPWRITDANPTIVEFTSTAPPSPTTPVDPGEPTVDNVKIRRITNLDDIRALFNPGSAIRSDDLNNNFEQLRYAIQESNCPGVPEEVQEYLEEYYWDRFDNTLYGADTWRSDDATIATTAALDARFQDELNETITSSESWVSDNDHIATTAAIDARFQDELSETITSSETWPDNDDTIATTAAIDNRIDTAITNDIGTDGTGITVTDDGDGTITLGLANIDLDRIKAEDIITQAEQNADFDLTGDDDSVFTSSAAIRRFENYVQNNAPSGTGIGTGRVWVDVDDDLTLSVWNGSAWTAITSGGTFTNQPSVVYVDQASGDDNNDGHRISRPKATIAAALDQINAEINTSITNGGSGYGEGTYNAVALTGGTGTGLTADIVVNASGVVTTVTVNNTTTLEDYNIGDVLSANATNLGGSGSGLQITVGGDGDGQIVIVSAGTYQEVAPLQIKRRNVSVIGQAMRSCIVHPTSATELNTLFELNSGSYIANLTLTGMQAGTGTGNTLDAVLPTNQGWNFAFYNNAFITKSPYIQNCTNFSDSEIDNDDLRSHRPRGGQAGDTDSAPTGGGLLVNGATPHADSPLRSMVADSYTHVALNGPGILVTNNGYTQITSSYAFFNTYHIKCLNGGQANLAASTTDFGDRSLVADGRSTTNIFTADCVTQANVNDTTIRVSNGVADASWHGTSTRPASNMLLSVNSDAQIYPITNVVPQDQTTFDADPAGYTGDWIVTISRPDPNNRSNNLGFSAQVATGTNNVQFWLRSMIASSGHTMEYVGSGTNYTALPENGGVPNEARQITESNNGKVWTAITDHNGKFRIGGNQTDDPIFEVDQQLGFVTIPEGSIAFNLLSDATPELAANLDANSNRITELADPTAAQDAATRNYVDNNSINNVVEDTTPQLGGDLDVNGQTITSASNGNIVIDPNGTGIISLGSNVGIGTTSPDGELDVTGTGDANGGVLVVNDAGAIGVEVVSPQPTILLNETDTTNENYQIRLDSGDLLIQTQNDARTGASTRVTIDSTGRVGVGTTSPDQILTLRQDNGGGEGASIRLHNSSATVGSNNKLIFTSSTNATAQSAAIIATRTASGTFITFESDGTNERLRIDESGRVGIGTSSPANNLHIRGAAANAGIRLQSDGGSGETYEIRSLTNGLLTIGTTLANVLNVTPSNVGIGTTAPGDFSSSANNLVISGTGNTGITIDATSSTQSNIYFADGATGNEAYRGYISYDHSTDAMRFGSAASTAVTIDSSQRLLVGTPTSALEKVVIKGDGGGLQINRNNSGSPTSGQALGSIGFKGIVSANSNAAAEVLIRAAADENHSGSTAGSRLEFHTKPSGTGPGSSPTERVRIESNGKTKFSGGVYGNETTITASDFDLNDGNFFTCGAIAIPNPTNGVAGMSGLIRVTAAPTSFGSNWDFPGGSYTAPTAFPAVAPFYIVSSTQFYLGNWTENIT